MIRLTLLLLMCLIVGCVSVDSLPDSAAEIDFSETTDHQTGWRTYEESHTFENVSRDLVYKAAKAALVNEDYDIITSSLADGLVMGEQGTTPLNWKLASGIYLDQAETDTEIRIIVKGVWDLLTWVPNWTLEGEAQRILKSMRLYIDTEVSSSRKSN